MGIQNQEEKMNKFARRISSLQSQTSRRTNEFEAIVKKMSVLLEKSGDDDGVDNEKDGPKASPPDSQSGGHSDRSKDANVAESKNLPATPASVDSSVKSPISELMKNRKSMFASLAKVKSFEYIPKNLRASTGALMLKH